jgi:outer membrane lipoprotein-sorting protein
MMNDEHKWLWRVLWQWNKAQLCALFITLILSPEMRANPNIDIKPYEDYMNALKSLEADFVQVDPNGQAFEGRLYLVRPSYMRIEYAKTKDGRQTVPLRLVADGSRMIHFDKELKETQLYSFDATPAGFFLQEQISFSKGVQVVRAESKEQLTSVTLKKSNDSEEGMLTFVFKENPIRLVKWIIKDAHDLETTITIQMAKENIIVNPQLFDPNFEDPQQPIVDEVLSLGDSPLSHQK